MEDLKTEAMTLPAGNGGLITTAVKDKPIAHIKKQRHRHNHLVIAMFGTGAVIAWLVLFSLGMLINSGPYRTALTTHFNLTDFLLTILTYTPTNIALLCLVSAFSGGCTSLLVISRAERALGLDKQDNTPKTSSHLYMSETPFSSMMRGIVVFFAFLAGVFVTSSNAFTAPTAQTYLQAAGVVSMLAFVVGYDPTVFWNLISIAEKIKGKNEGSD